MTERAIVPDDFSVPTELVTPQFRLEPLGPQHNKQDYDAWTSSVEHIHATPGWQDGAWPPASGMSPAENLADLQQHANDFADRIGFTYTVIETAGRVIGCVYIYPARSTGHDVRVRSWVCADRAELDKPLYEAVTAWLCTDWPLGTIDYQPR